MHLNMIKCSFFILISGILGVLGGLGAVLEPSWGRRGGVLGSFWVRLGAIFWDLWGHKDI